MPHGAQRENIRPELRKAGPSRRPGYRNECRINRPFIPLSGGSRAAINIERLRDPTPYVAGSSRNSASVRISRKLCLQSEIKGQSCLSPEPRPPASIPIYLERRRRLLLTARR